MVQSGKVRSVSIWLYTVHHIGQIHFINVYRKLQTFHIQATKGEKLSKEKLRPRLNYLQDANHCPHLTSL